MRYLYCQGGRQFMSCDYLISLASGSSLSLTSKPYVRVAANRRNWFTWGCFWKKESKRQLWLHVWCCRVLLVVREMLGWESLLAVCVLGWKWFFRVWCCRWAVNVNFIHILQQIHVRTCVYNTGKRYVYVCCVNISKSCRGSLLQAYFVCIVSLYLFFFVKVVLVKLLELLVSLNSMEKIFPVRSLVNFCVT